MKIKNQFLLFLLGTVAVPLLCVLAIVLYNYFLSPERILIKGYKEIQTMDSLPITDTDWQMLYHELKHIPPDVQMAIIVNHTEILLSTIPELQTGKSFNDTDLSSLLKQTSRKYFYQFGSPPIENDKIHIMVISRVPRQHGTDRQRIYRFIIPVLTILTIFELFCITVIIHISNTISRSITILERNTQRIADGELNLKLHSDPKNSNEITSLIENLDKMRRALKEDQQQRARFIMGISHDLRTPVAVIKGYTEAISDGVADDPAAIKNALEIIGTKTNQLETMIDTLINFVKLNNSEWRNKLIPQPLEPTIVEFAKGAMMTGEVFKRTVTSSINISPRMQIPFDRQLFQRALENLFSNALRYTQEDDSIIISAKESSDNNNIIITVEDTGAGIAEKDRSHLFELFYRGTNSRREEGMGIGLSVVKNIIDTHGWSIDVQSEEGKGTAFIITIPKKN